MNRLKAILWALTVSIASTGVVLVFHRFVLVQTLEMHAPFMPFLMAVLAAVWFGGTPSGAITTVLGAVIGVYLSSNRSSFSLRPDFQARLLMFIGSGVLVTWMVGTLKTALNRRAEAEGELREREQQFRMGAEAGGVGIWDFNPRTREHKWLGRSQAMFGLSPDADVNDEQFLARLFPEDRGRVVQAIQNALDPSGDGKYEVEYRTIWPDGTIRWVLAKGEAIFEGEKSERRAVRGLGTVLDITERKQAADALEVEREHLRHTIVLQDQERQLIAYEIHDGVIQYATGALMRLEGVQSRVKSDPIAAEIDDIVGILRKTVTEGRQLINGIRPPVLDDQGLVAAVEHLIEEEARAHVQVEFIKDEAIGRLAPNLEETLYRIAQEALTNVRKHSRANRARVELGRVGNRVRLAVQDWGVGFTQGNGSKHIHGLAGMTNRARVVGGQCTIKSVPGQGAQIVVDVPYVARDGQNA